MNASVYLARRSSIVPGMGDAFVSVWRVQWVHHGNIPARPASDWSITGIYPRALRPIGPS
eukprot:1191631-Prorocentrum_minimum.AAC.6